MRKVERTSLAWSSLGEWARQTWEIHANFRASWQAYHRQYLHFISLTAADIRASSDRAGLEAVRAVMWSARYAHRPRIDLGFRGQQGWRGYVAVMLTEIHNRLDRLDRGPAALRDPKGGDPSRMPDDALLRVIQSHRDMAFVERCRAELAWRLTRTAA